MGSTFLIIGASTLMGFCLNSLYNTYQETRSIGSIKKIIKKDGIVFVEGKGGIIISGSMSSLRFITLDLIKTTIVNTGDTSLDRMYQNAVISYAYDLIGKIQNDKKTE